MKTLAAVMTGSGSSAVATVEVMGPDAFCALSRIFSPNGPKPLAPQVGSVRVGSLKDNDRVIDRVALACEGPQHWTLHCHGNPLIVEVTMALLEGRGLTLVSAQDMQTRKLKHVGMSVCQQEAYLALTRCKTLVGARLLDHQMREGLTRWAQQTYDNLDDLHSQCRTILEQSRMADLVLDGVTVALIGPPNSGKSTLLNSLSGQDAAVVTHVKGTTRDWVEASCRTERLALRLIDTAGLDSTLQEKQLDAESQRRTREVMNRAHVIVLVLDSSDSNAPMESSWLDGLPNVPCLTVLNKSDLPAQLNLKDLNLDPAQTVLISAKQQTGLSQLLGRIEQTLHIEDFDVNQPLCITSRQRERLHQLSTVRTLAEAQRGLESLVSGT